MKKKILITFFVIVAAILAFSTTAFAAQKTELPVTMVNIDGSNLTMYTFDVTNVYTVTNDYNRIEFKHHVWTGGVKTLAVYCYDDRGYRIATVDFNVKSTYINVPRYTATIEFAGEDPRWSSDSYLYKNLVTVYAADGRKIQITDLQLPLYEQLGWSRVQPELPVKMSQKNGSSLTMFSFDITSVYPITDTCNRIEFKQYSEDWNNPECVVNCYNDAGYFIATTEFDKSRTYIDVPRDTATIEFTVKNPRFYSGSYLHRKFVTMYAADGRTLKITDLQVPVYESLGWRPYPASKTELPVKMIQKDGSSLTLNSFWAYHIYNISDTCNRVNIYHNSEVNGNPEVMVYCYNDLGYHIATVDLDIKNASYFDVPCETATIELTVKNPAENNESYLYRQFVTMYAADGRTLEITDLQSPLYEKVGWTGITRQSRTFSIIMQQQDGSALYMNAFEVTDVYCITDTHNRIEFKQDSTNWGTPDGVVYCYNE